MKKGVTALAALLALSGCQISSEEDQLENAIAEALSNQGAVEEVNLVRADENNMTGYALIRDAEGRSGRLSCTAARTEGTNFDWRCSPVIDEGALQDIENSIRETMSARAEVIEVDMQRDGDDNRMAGFVRVRDLSGGEVRANCDAVRNEGGNFNWRCGDAVSGARQAAVAGGPK